MSEYSDFIKQYPKYKNSLLDQIRKNEFPNLGNIVYADWTGTALKPISLVEQYCNLIKKNLFGNTHSQHDPSKHSEKEIESTREVILDFFNADPDKYDVIFTSNATNAILILQHYRFEKGKLLLTADNHNSVNGLREIAKKEGAIVRYSPINNKLQIDSDPLINSLSNSQPMGNQLFCYPAKSNHTGNTHSLKWIKLAQKNSWDVLLDTASFVANNPLDLSEISPDFVPISFYKIFGFPTGVGCLIIKKSKYKKLEKGWFSGGTVEKVGIKEDYFLSKTACPI